MRLNRRAETLPGELRLDLRACWAANDKRGAETALARLWQVVGNDNELVAEARRWSVKFA